VWDRRSAQEVTSGFPEEVAVIKNVGEGVLGSTMWARSGITGGGSEVIRVISMKGVARDELETHGLEVAGVREEDALSKDREDG